MGSSSDGAWDKEESLTDVQRLEREAWQLEVRAKAAAAEAEALAIKAKVAGDSALEAKGLLTESADLGTPAEHADLTEGTEALEEAYKLENPYWVTIRKDALERWKRLFK